ncbi:Hemolysin precursor [Serratia liquefaciens]|nr:Hemolysin precursor [Serratia liquefaciens]
MKMKTMSFVLSSLAILCQSSAAFADITPQQGSASVSNINNVPVVNIKAAGTDGVSHNQYSQFDVDQRGVVLNNSVGGSTSGLAGALAGNSNLANGAASMILNEVNSSNKSILNGMVEVAGQRANVVIANKSGITCNGCGFINANDGVLTTGELQFKNGTFSGYQVTQGEVSFDGKGLQKGDVDYTAVLARTEKINAALNAKTLLVVAGKNDISANMASIQKLPSEKQANQSISGVQIISGSKGKTIKLTGASPATDSSVKPDVSIDVSELGGMYAGRIMLIANEQGIGVNPAKGINNRGIIQTNERGVTLLSEELTNSGTISSSGPLNMSSSALVNSGALKTNSSLSISSGSFKNSGNIESEAGLRIGASTLENKPNGVINSKGPMLISSSQLVNQGAIKSTEGALKMTTSAFKNDNGGVIESKGLLSVNGSSVLNKGTITSRQSSVSFTDTTFANTGKVEAAGNISHKGYYFVNNGSMTAQSGFVTNNGKKIK